MISAFVELSDGCTNGASRPIYFNTQLTALYSGW